MNLKIGFLIIGCLVLAFSACALKKKRLLPIEGAYNVRDLGGYKTAQGKTVKWGMVYRSGDLNHLTPTDLDELKKRNLKTIVDFRGKEERDKAPDKMPETVKNVHHIPVDPGNIIALSEFNAENGTELMRSLNEALVNGAKSEYTTFFEILSDPENTPLLFHCSAGKDRAGFAAVLFLSSLGVDRETIYQDYLLSADCVKEKYAPLVKENPHLAPLMTVKREYLDKAFEVIDNNYGGIENYLSKELGVDINRMRSIYTE